MTRKLFTAVLLVLLTISIAPVQVYAAVSQTQDELLLIKKKNKLEALKATDAAKLKADRLKVAKVAVKRDCGSFMQCLFGKSRRTSASLTGTGLSGRSMRKQVAWNETKYAPGTLIVKTPERALYYVLGEGAAMRYSIGVGREGFQWGGNSHIVAKTEWPEWHPPAQMIVREAAKGHMLPDMMPGGPVIPWAHAPCTSAARFTASMARTMNPPLAARFHRAAFA